MNARTLNGILVFLAAAGVVSTGACDAVRSGTYFGSFPDPMTVDIPQTPEFQSAVTAGVMARGGQIVFPHALDVTLRTWRLTSGRAWSFAGRFTALQGELDDDAIPATLDINVWPSLASALNVLRSEGEPAPVVAAGVVEVSATPGLGGPMLIAADVNHILFEATEEVSIEPMGPAGPTLSLTRGFHVFERACTPNGLLSFTEVPIDVVARPIEVGVADWASPALTADPFVAGCGVDASAPIALGTVAAPVPLDPVIPAVTAQPGQPVIVGDPTPPPMTVQAFGWMPASDGVYLLAHRPDVVSASDVPPAQLRLLTAGASPTTLLVSDDLVPPMAVSTGGSSVLVWQGSPGYWGYVRQSLSAALTPSKVLLNDFYNPGPTGPLFTALSADGNLLALASPQISFQPLPELRFVDLRTATAIMQVVSDPFGPAPQPAGGYIVVPRAWDPTGVALLVEIWGTANVGEHVFATVALDGAGGLPVTVGAPVPLPTAALPAALASGRSATGGVAPDTSVRYFWSASGPQVLIQDAEGARVYNFVTQQTVAIVEPALVATAGTGTDVAVATEQVFAWAVQCFGLGETSCRTWLRRLTLATGVVDVVATADQARPFAASPDGRQLVLADDASIYLKTIAP